jgi:hypothetical protein
MSATETALATLDGMTRNRNNPVAKARTMVSVAHRAIVSLVTVAGIIMIPM